MFHTQHLTISQNTGNYTFTYLNDGTENKRQDVIIFTDPLLAPFSIIVPEPNSFALIGLGLVGPAFGKRKEATVIITKSPGQSGAFRYKV
jgi:hypothetical protein